jgi:hypothetical protein
MEVTAKPPARKINTMMMLAKTVFLANAATMSRMGFFRQPDAGCLDF